MNPSVTQHRLYAQTFIIYDTTAFQHFLLLHGLKIFVLLFLLTTTHPSNFPRPLTRYHNLKLAQFFSSNFWNHRCDCMIYFVCLLKITLHVMETYYTQLASTHKHVML